MTRMYVIMEDTGAGPEPYDIVPSMSRAEDICILEEARANAKGKPTYYYWREVISSIDWSEKNE